MSDFDVASAVFGGLFVGALVLFVHVTADWLHGRRLARSPEGKS